MADQEFLASFGVEIDESGVERLQTALEENRTLAEELAAAFDDARASVQAFFASLGEISLPGMNAVEARSAEEPSGIKVATTPVLSSLKSLMTVICVKACPDVETVGTMLLRKVSLAT